MGYRGIDADLQGVDASEGEKRADISRRTRSRYRTVRTATLWSAYGYGTACGGGRLHGGLSCPACRRQSSSGEDRECVSGEVDLCRSGGSGNGSSQAAPLLLEDARPGTPERL